ncbi:iron complex transport system substrate-binding protein [Marinobacter daqiaonensis]|uniref:Iron complex transport system substrate-binding protein n=1 Tax=Marinobacter daqiaonensis TaxID=650891 RepID=A0A1I6J9T6_9GAMM|nr:ABC transporter substrate-binding protein [Marinobacter daqiaonensis]SFR75714.1 iron complex transport system substrate-binding protein [Marinobacter daqiaonensis]
MARAAFACLFLLGLLAGWPALAATPEDAPAPRIATVDWTLAETMLSLGVVPVGVAQIADYQAWVEEPRLPEEVVDLGLRAQPNRELMASLDLDHTLLSPLYRAIEPTLSHIAPVTTLATYTSGGDLWQNLVTTTRQVAEITGRQSGADDVIEQHRRRIDRVGDALDADLPPLLVIQFIDNRHVRVFGEGSLYNMVMERLGIENAWQGSTNLWGFATVGIEKLATPGHLVVVEPMPMGVREELEQNRLWQLLPPVRQQRLFHLPAVWSFGGLPSAARFAEELGQALTTRPPSKGI